MQVKVCFGVNIRDLPVIEIHRRAQTDLLRIFGIFCVLVQVNVMRFGLWCCD
jgi:hypothetical protein